MNLNRREFLKKATAAAIVAGTDLAARSESAHAELQIEELPSGTPIQDVKPTAEQQQLAEQAHIQTVISGIDSLDSEYGGANDNITLKDAATPELKLSYAAIVSGILSGLQKHRQSVKTPKSKLWGVSKWQSIKIGDSSVDTIGVAHVEKTLRQSFPTLLEEIRKHDALVLESIHGGKTLQKTRDALLADPSILEYPETFADWRKRTGSKGFFDILANCGLALNKRVFVTDPCIDSVGDVMFLTDLAAALAGVGLIVHDVKLLRSAAGIPVLVTVLSHMKQIGETSVDVNVRKFSKSLREYTPQKFARLMWDVNDWRDIHAAMTTRRLIESGEVSAGGSVLLIRGAAHGPSVTRYLSAPGEAQAKRLAYPHWEFVRTASDVVAKMTKKDATKHSFELMSDLSRRALPE